MCDHTQQFPVVLDKGNQFVGQHHRVPWQGEGIGTEGAFPEFESSRLGGTGSVNELLDQGTDTFLVITGKFRGLEEMTVSALKDPLSERLVRLFRHGERCHPSKVGNPPDRETKDQPDSDRDSGSSNLPVALHPMDEPEAALAAPQPFQGSESLPIMRVQAAAPRYVQCTTGISESRLR